MSPEHQQLSRFVEIAKVSGELEFTDIPDLLVRRKGHTLGVEHTRLLRPSQPGSDLRAFESIMIQAVRQAQASHDAKNPGGLWVGIHPNDQIRLTARDRESIAVDLEAVVRKFRPLDSEHVRVHAWEARTQGFPFPKAVHSVSVARFPEMKDSLWYPSWSCYVPDLPTEEVTARVAKKDARVSAYRKRCDEVWLVIAIENFSGSGTWELENYPFDRPIKTCFERLFLHDLFRAEVFELTTH